MPLFLLIVYVNGPQISLQPLKITKELSTDRLFLQSIADLLCCGDPIKPIFNRDGKDRGEQAGEEEEYTRQSLGTMPLPRPPPPPEKPCAVRIRDRQAVAALEVVRWGEAAGPRVLRGGCRAAQGAVRGQDGVH